MSKGLGRVFGLVRALTSLSWVVLSIAGLLLAPRALDELGRSIDDSLAVAVDSLDIVQDSLDLSMGIVAGVSDALNTVGTTAVDVSHAIRETRPLLDETSQMVTEDVPEALDGVREAMPNVINAMRLVDRTLFFLAGFQFTIPNPLGADIDLGLGIDYAPEQPLGDAFDAVNTGLEEIPGTLREMRGNITDASSYLLAVSGDMSTLSVDLNSVTGQLSAVEPQLEEASASIDEVSDSIQGIRRSLPPALDNLRKVLIGLLALLGVSQVPSIYIGWLLTRGRLAK
jgi:methyl-accepting chemotaxis protein